MVQSSRQRCGQSGEGEAYRTAWRFALRCWWLRALFTTGISFRRSSARVVANPSRAFPTLIGSLIGFRSSSLFCTFRGAVKTVAIVPSGDRIVIRQPHLDMSGSSKRLSIGRIVFVAVGIGLVAVASISGMYRILSTAIAKVIAGHGGDTYTTVWLVEVSYIGILVDTVVICIAYFVAIFFAWREESEWRDFERKYGARK